MSNVPSIVHVDLHQGYWRYRESKTEVSGRIVHSISGRAALVDWLLNGKSGDECYTTGVNPSYVEQRGDLIAFGTCNGGGWPAIYTVAMELKDEDFRP